MDRKPWHKETEHRKITGRRWQKIRMAVFARDLFTCRDCKRIFQPNELHCDHIIPLSKGGSDDYVNLQCMCTKCHESKTIRENGGTPKSPIGVDGWPIT